MAHLYSTPFPHYKRNKKFDLVSKSTISHNHWHHYSFAYDTKTQLTTIIIGIHSNSSSSIDQYLNTTHTTQTAACEFCVRQSSLVLYFYYCTRYYCAVLHINYFAMATAT